ncbi:hypothetical protein K474DRAFT_1700885 [Panus rudis PR-1116 ss-1]|nr:hypothetical protein K474DRAFT_1700885 [Panus rudis PR-1116 ss-1]
MTSNMNSAYQAQLDAYGPSNVAKGNRDVPQYEVDESFYFPHVIFLVEGVLYKVYRREFEKSEVFAAMFTLPGNGNVNAEGNSNENPIRLDGISKNDFHRLLRVMYPRNEQDNRNLTTEEWISVLKLATMWAFQAIRQTAIQSLATQLQTDPVEKINLAQAYNIREWLIPTLNSLAQRRDMITSAEAERLGMDYTLKLVQVRERFYSRALRRPCLRCRTGGYHGARLFDDDEMVPGSSNNALPNVGAFLFPQFPPRPAMDERDITRFDFTDFIREVFSL